VPQPVADPDGNTDKMNERMKMNEKYIIENQIT